MKRGLGELDLPDVVLGDRQLRLTVPEHVREVRPSGDDPRCPCRERAVDRAVGREHTREMQLGDDLDDPGAADARDLRAREPGSSDQASQPITWTRGSSVSRVDPDALDRARARRAARS